MLPNDHRNPPPGAGEAFALLSCSNEILKHILKNEGRVSLALLYSSSLALAASFRTS